MQGRAVLKDTIFLQGRVQRFGGGQNTQHRSSVPSRLFSFSILQFDYQSDKFDQILSHIISVIILNLAMTYEVGLLGEMDSYFAVRLILSPCNIGQPHSDASRAICLSLST